MSDVRAWLAGVLDGITASGLATDLEQRGATAHRGILRHHAPKPAKRHPGYDCQWCCYPYTPACFDVLTIAAVYADRPGFDPAWDDQQ